MPKETIYPEECNDARRIDVQWARDKYVQIGVEAIESPENAIPWWNGQFLSLDRNEINRLIRILRKARDQAFGADA